MINANIRKQGYSLVELIIIISLIGILAPIAGMVLSAGFKAALSGITLGQLSQESGQALTLMARELRNATSISAISSNSISFTKLNHSGTITYDVDGNTLRRSPAAGSTPQSVTTHLSSLSINGYATDLSATTNAANVKLINIELSLTQNNSTTSLIKTVFPRNL